MVSSLLLLTLPLKTQLTDQQKDGCTKGVGAGGYHVLLTLSQTLQPHCRFPSDGMEVLNERTSSTGCFFPGEEH